MHVCVSGVPEWLAVQVFVCVCLCVYVCVGVCLGVPCVGVCAGVCVGVCVSLWVCTTISLVWTYTTASRVQGTLYVL